MITIVSGLPRSGTSLMMQMLERGGVPVITDSVRAPDIDNPRGYLELEKVKAIKKDASWLPQARGKAVKMVSQLLYELPRTERYRIIFMERDLDEVLVSQDKMLERWNRPAAPREQVKGAFIGHLDRLRTWLAGQPNMEILYVNYKELVDRPAEIAERFSTFVCATANAREMAQCVDPALYRNRKDEHTTNETG
jgi:hypothetical protein